MKRFLFTIIGLLIPVLSIAQQIQPPKYEANIEDITMTTQLFKLNTMQQRLKSISIDLYSSGSWTFSDSVKYTYSGTHNQADFTPFEIENFYLLPDFDNMLWLDFDGVLWTNYVQCEQTFDVNGYKQENLFSSWSGADWINYTRYLYEYNAAGQRLNQTIQIWTGVVFENAVHINYTYNANGLEEVNYFNWTGTDFEPSTRKVYAYNGYGQLEYYTQYYWTGLAWENDDRTVYYCDSEGQLEETLHQIWISPAWANNTMNTYTYNTDGFLIENIVLIWDGIAWQNYIRNTAYMDANNVILSTTRDWWDGMLWMDYYRFRFTYEDFDDGTVAVPETNISYAIKIFPNPTQRNVNVLLKSRGEAIGQLEIRDMYGQLVGNMEVALHLGENLLHIDLASMGISTGAYTLSIRTGSKTFVGKLLVTL